MASRQYEMLFKLGARLGENFKGTFNSAQKVLAATQKEIQALNKQQSDISAYQKQQAGLDKTTKQLDTYKKQLEITQSGLAKLKQSTEDTTVQQTQLAAREVELKNRIANTEQAIADKTQRLQQMGQKLAEAGVDTNQLAKESERLKGQLEDLSKQEEQAAKEAELFGESGESAFEMVGAALVAAGIATALKGITEAYKECIGVSMEFGATMSTVEALSSSNALQMVELTDKAKELGAETAFTANQAASAMTYMGMAGWGAEEMLSGMDGMINLAAASGEDLALVSDIVTDNLTAFGLTARDTAHFADVLAAAATNSNTNVAIMGETFSGSAAIAGALGYSIEDVAVGVGLMANAGVKGSIAGTALKNMFNGLLNGATLTAEAFGEVEFSAINADGTIDSFSDTIQELRVYFDQMTEAERVQNAMLIAGQRGYNGLLAIVNSTESDFQKLTDKINNCTGAAQKMSDIKLDNLQGDVTLLDSATDGLKMTLGDMYNDELRNLAQIGTQIITGINEFCENNPVLVKSIIAIAAEASGALLIYNGFIAAKKIKNTLSAVSTALTIKEAAASASDSVAKGAQAAATNAATAAQTKLNLAMLANPVGWVVGLVGALTVGIVALTNAETQEEKEQRTLIAVAEEQQRQLSELNAEYENARELHGENSEEALKLRYEINSLNEEFEANKQTISEYKSELSDMLEEHQATQQAYDESARSIEESSLNTLALVTRLRELSVSTDDSLAKQGEMKAIIDKLNSSVDGLSLSYEELASGQGAGFETIMDIAEQQYKLQEYNKDMERLVVLYEEYAAAERQQAKAKEQLAAVEKEYGISLDEYEAILKKAQKGLELTYEEMLFQENEEIYEAFKPYYDALSDSSDEINRITAEQSEICDRWNTSLEDTTENAQASISVYDIMSGSMENVREQTSALLQAYNDAYQAAYDSVNGQYNLWTQAEETIPTSIDTITNALSSQTEYWDNYNYNLETLSERADDIVGLSDVIASFADGSTDSVNAIAGMADATDEELEAMVRNFQEQQKMQEEVSKTLAEYRVDIDEQMNDMVSDMEAAVEDMNMSETAEQAAKDTIQAYAEAILSGKGSAVEAAEIVAQATSNALAAASSADYYNNNPTAFNPADPYGYQKAYEKAEYQKAIAFDPADPYNLAAYASGTDNAARGIALVGEEGPELVMMHGGERVIDAKNTEAILSGGGSGVQINIAPQFVINSEVSESTENKLQEMSMQLVDMVKEALEEAGIDRQRSVYA